VPLILTNDEVVPLVNMQDSLLLLEEAYRACAQGRALNVPYSYFDVPLDAEGRYYRMYELRACMPEAGISAVRLISTVMRSAGATHQLATGADRKRVDQVFLFDIQTGGLLAIVAAEHIQLLRVAATSALGAKHLARQGAGPETLGIVGTGAQAETQLEAMALVRSLGRVLVYSRSAENRQRFVEQVQDRYPFPIRAADSVEALVRESDIVTSATNATVPTFDGSLLRPGCHVNSLSGAQVDAATLERASIFVTSKGPRTVFSFPTGEPHPGHGQVEFDKQWDRIQELERVLIGEIEGRRSDDEITLFLGGGAGLQFAALGHAVYRRAREQSVGRDLPEEWFVSN
jgi:alanine dehydrogenase